MELDLMRTQMGFASSRITELEFEKEQFEAVRVKLETRIKEQDDEIATLRDNESKASIAFEETLREWEAKYNTACHGFEAKKADMTVSL